MDKGEIIREYGKAAFEQLLERRRKWCRIHPDEPKARALWWGGNYLKNPKCIVWEEPIFPDVLRGWGVMIVSTKNRRKAQNENQHKTMD